MAKRDASISIELDAQTAKLERKIDDATGNLKDLNVTLQNLQAGFDLLTRAWDRFAQGIDVAVRAIEHLNEKTLEYANFGLESLRTGIDPTVLLNWADAAAMAGVEADQLTEAAFELNKRLGEARTERSGTSFEAFQRLGLDIDQVRTPEQLVDEVFRRLQISRGENQQLADFLADELLGDMGRNLTPLIADWSNNIDKAQESVLGLNTDTEQLIRSSELYREELAQTQMLYKEIERAILSEVIPVLGGFLIALREFVQETIGLGQSLVKIAAVIGQVAFALAPGGLAVVSAFGPILKEAIKQFELELELRGLQGDRQVRAPGLGTALAPAITTAPALRPVTRERGAFARSQELQRQERAEELQRQQIRLLREIADNTEEGPPAADIR